MSVSKRGGFSEAMKFGAKLFPIGSPFASTKRPEANTDPAAASTPFTFRTLASRVAGKAGGVASFVSTFVCAVIATSVPFSDSVKISSNDLLIVSVRT